jgi:hypothetical protein
MRFKLLFVAFAFYSAIYAQDADNVSVDTIHYWKKGGVGSVTFSQSSFSSSWQGGGENNISGLVLINLFANYAKDKSSWDNVLDFKYGTLKKGKQDWTKSDDKLELTSKYGYQAIKKWYYSVLFNAKTQVTNGYDAEKTDSLISAFAAPMFIVLSVGMDYKPSDIFSAHLSPLSGKLTIVGKNTLSDAGRYGVDPGDHLRFEFGATAKFMLKKEIIRNIILQSNLQLFQAYQKGASLDVDWDVNINMKINKYISASIIGQLIYDKDQIDEIQWKEIFGLGFSYSFN